MDESGGLGWVEGLAGRAGRRVVLEGRGFAWCWKGGASRRVGRAGRPDMQEANLTLTSCHAGRASHRW